MTVTIQRTSADGLACNTWRFYVTTDHGRGIRVVLDEFTSQFKPSRRHGWRPSGVWTRIDQRSNTIKERPVVPHNVQADAIAEIHASIEFRNDLN